MTGREDFITLTPEEGDDIA